MSIDHAVETVERVVARLRGELLEEQGAGGGAHWTGELAASALSTATACSALALTRRAGGTATEFGDLDAVVERGVRWLAAHQNSDGGWGDTDRSPSNISTSLLAIAAGRITGHRDTAAEARAWGYVESAGSWAGLRARYGRDKTFVVPILCNCALAGLVDWREVAPLPFEAAAVPQRLYRFLRLPVVSYAIPALVAIGQTRFHHAPPRNPVVRGVRAAAVGRTLSVLEAMQPESGGYLEATPLTSFVLMSLASIGRSGHPVGRRCLRFLLESQRADGSWPIDTNLATWVTSLSIQALRGDVADRPETWLSAELLEWLRGCQHRVRHPFTGADPGGWGWSDLSGAVPDADDTPAALLALAACRESLQATGDASELGAAVGEGVAWLLGLQNRDGGWPTFCRGWGKLPFDRSSTDLTAHALRALDAWRDSLAAPVRRRVDRAMRGGFAFLDRAQCGDGSWLPLWFGNHDAPGEENPIYGTGRVLLAYLELGREESQAARRGIAYLLAQQNADGGWGGGESLARRLAGQGESSDRAAWASSMEETGVALAALASGESAGGGRAARLAAIIRGIEFLDRRIAAGRHRLAWPIGFYFAKLWYYERLYPLVFGTEGAARARRYLAGARLDDARSPESHASDPTASTAHP